MGLTKSSTPEDCDDTSALSASPVGTSEPSSFSRPPLLAADRGRLSPRPPSAPRTGYAQAHRAADSRAGTGPIRVSNANPFTVNGRLAGQTMEKLLVKRGKPKRRVKLPSRPLRVAARAQDGEAEAPACGRPQRALSGRISLRMTARVREPAGNRRTVGKDRRGRGASAAEPASSRFTGPPHPDRVYLGPGASDADLSRREFLERRPTRRVWPIGGGDHRCSIAFCDQYAESVASGRSLMGRSRTQCSKDEDGRPTSDTQRFARRAT